MNRFRCKYCGLTSQENELIITVNSDSEWVIHCPNCNSELLELANELTNQSPHSLKTYYELEEDL